MHPQFFSKLFVCLAVPNGDKGCNGLSFEIIGSSHNSSFTDGWMTHQCAFHFNCAEPMSRNIDHVVDASHDPVVPIIILPGIVASQINPGDSRPILLDESFFITIDATKHAWPRIADAQHAAMVIFHGISSFVDNLWHDAGQRSGA